VCKACPRVKISEIFLFLVGKLQNEALKALFKGVLLIKRMIFTVVSIISEIFS